MVSLGPEEEEEGEGENWGLSSNTSSRIMACFGSLHVWCPSCEKLKKMDKKKKRPRCFQEHTTASEKSGVEKLEPNSHLNFLMDHNDTDPSGLHVPPSPPTHSSLLHTFSQTQS